MEKIISQLIIGVICMVGVGGTFWNLKRDNNKILRKLDQVVSENMCKERRDVLCKKQEQAKGERENLWDAVNHHSHSCCADKGESKVMR